MNFAVIKFGGKQHLVTPGQKLQVEGNLAEKPGDLELSEVLLLSVGDNLQIGAPLVAGAKVPAKIVSIEKGKKIDIYKFKAKSRYRNHTGFRPFVTNLEIGNFGEETKIESKEAPEKQAAPKKSAKAKK